MLNTLLSRDNPLEPKKNIEGEIYKVVNIKGKTFELKYGYYEEIDRTHNEPDVIYPDLLSEPQYTDGGQPIVTMMQDACEHFVGNKSADIDCSKCAYFERSEDLFGICRFTHAKKHSKK